MIKKVFVTGGSKGIGLAIVNKFYNEGHEVHFCDLAKPDQDQSAGIHYYKCDISNHDQVKNLYEHFKVNNIKFQSIVNNAGINLHASIKNISIEDWDRVIKTNVYGPFYICKYLHKLLDTSNAAIVNIGSDQSVIAKKNRAAYCTSKGAVLQFTRSLAVDLAEDNIRVNCVCPGPIETPMMHELTKGRKFKISQPISRVGKPEEIADAVFFLCSKNASYITGASIMIDGGYTAM